MQRASSIPVPPWGLAIAAMGQEIRVDELAVRDVWARATPGLAATGAVYLTISNHGQDTDRLVAVLTPVADRAA